MKLQRPFWNGTKAGATCLPITHRVVRQYLGTTSHVACKRSLLSREIINSAVVEAATGAVVQAANEQPPSLNFTEVTRHNFKAVLPAIKSAVHEATFVAIDTEFTGLSPEGMGEDPLDDYEERYKRLLASADSFVICQFGLSAFKWHAAPGAARGGHWEAKTFNAYIFPRPDDKMGWDKRFLCQASSLSYLAEKGFDFNKMIHDGISFIPLALRDAKARMLREEHDKTQRSRELRSAEEEELVEAARARVLSWLLGSEPELLLQMPPKRRLRTLLRLLLQEEFQLPSLGYDPFAIELCIRATDKEDGTAAALDEGAIVCEGISGPVVSAISGLVEGAEGAEEVEVADETSSDREESGSEEGPTGREDAEGFMRLRRLDQWRPNGLIASGQQLTPRQRIEILVEQSGFSQVLDIIREAERPLVGHNASLDLAYTLAQFNGTLPRNWRTYKAQLQRAFPGGLYDTKHIATQLVALGVPVGDTGLGSLYRTLTDEQWLRANVPAAGLPAALGGGVPEIRHAPGFTGYVGASLEKAHEAGFDAFMTGTAFARLLRLISARTALQSGGAAADGVGGGVGDVTTTSSPLNTEADALLQPLGPYRGRIHVTRSDLPYADMFGSDPFPSRPSVMFVAGFGTQTRPPWIVQRFASMGLSPVQVCMLNGPHGGAIGAFVQLSRADLVPRALQTVRKRFSSWTVMTFAEYYQGRLQQQQQQLDAATVGGAAGSWGGASGTAGTAGRVAPRMIRTTSAAAAVVGGSQSPVEADLATVGSKTQRWGEGDASLGVPTRTEGSVAATVASSDTPEPRKQNQAAASVMNERQRLQVFTQVVAAAASSAGALASRQKPAESGAEVTAAEEGMGSRGQISEGAATASTSYGSVVTAEAAAGASDDVPHPELGQYGRDDDSTPSTAAQETSSLSDTGSAAPGGTATGGGSAALSRAGGSNAVADAEVAKRAAERLRSLALAVQRLKSLPAKDEPQGSPADNNGLSLQRPGRPSR